MKKTLVSFLFFILLSTLSTGKKWGKSERDDALKIAKSVYDGIKDGLTTFKSIATQPEALAILSVCGPIGNVLGIVLSIITVTYEIRDKKNKLSEVEALSQQMSALSRHLEGEFKRLRAQNDKNFFQDQVSFPEEKLNRHMMEFITSLTVGDEQELNEDRTNFLDSCKQNKPIDIYVAMLKMLKDNSENTMEYRKYTDIGFADYKQMYQEVATRLAPAYLLCEWLRHDYESGKSDDQLVRSTVKRINILKKKLKAIEEDLENIDAKRANGLWETMPGMLKDLHNDIRISKNKWDLQAFAKNLNKDYVGTGYLYTVGTHRNKTRGFVFQCKQDACLYETVKRTIIWVFRNKPCQNDPTLLASRCLEFELQQQSFMGVPGNSDAATITETITRNCNIESAVGVFNERLHLKSYGLAEFAQVNNYTQTKYEFEFKGITKPSIYSMRDFAIYSDCTANSEGFDYFKHNCKKTSRFPYCVIKARLSKS